MGVGLSKIEIGSIRKVNGEKVFVLRFIQGRNADWVQPPLMAEYDEQTT